MNQAGDIFLVLESGLQRIHEGGQLRLRTVNRLERNLLIVIVQILAEEHGMIPLLLRLHLIPVGKSLQTLFLVKVRKSQIEIGRIELFVDLLIEQLCYVLVQHIVSSLLLYNQKSPGLFCSLAG